MSPATEVPNPRGDASRACVVALFIISTLVVAARILTRVFVVRNPGFDDATAAIAWLIDLGVTVAFCYEVDYGMGLHMGQLPASDVPSLMKAIWSLQLMYNLCLYWTKLAMIAQLLRIFTERTFRRITFAVLAFTTVVSLFTVTASVIFCIPIQAYWDFSIKAAYCLPHVITFYTCAGLNVVNDLIILILPLPVLQELNLPTRQKYALIGVFALGFFVCVTSAVRLKKLSDVTESKDISYAYINVSVWSAIECSTGIICVSLPALKATITRYFPKLLSPLRSVHRGFSKNDGPGAPHKFPGHLTELAHRLESVDTGPVLSRTFSEARPDPVVRKQSEGRIGVTTIISQEVRHNIQYCTHGQVGPLGSDNATSDQSFLQAKDPARFA